MIKSTSTSTNVACCQRLFFLPLFSIQDSAMKNNMSIYSIPYAYNTEKNYISSFFSVCFSVYAMKHTIVIHIYDWQKIFICILL